MRSRRPPRGARRRARRVSCSSVSPYYPFQRALGCAHEAGRTAAAVRLTAEGSGKDRGRARWRGGIERELRRRGIAADEDLGGRRDRYGQRRGGDRDRRAALGAEGAEVAVGGVVALFGSRWGTVLAAVRAADLGGRVGGLGVGEQRPGGVERHGGDREPGGGAAAVAEQGHGRFCSTDRGALPPPGCSSRSVILRSL